VPAPDSVQVTVRDGWLVVDPTTGEQTGARSILDVPPELAEQWIAAGWVEPSQPATKRGK
jgi:hypothetical protein